MSHKTKMLMLSFAFPPRWGVATFRISKFCKYLPKNGVEPVVVYAKCKSNGEGQDNTLLSDVSDTRSYGVFPVLSMSPNIWACALAIWLPIVIMRERPRVIFGTGSPWIPLLWMPFLNFVWRIPYIFDIRDPWAHHPTHKASRSKWYQWIVESLESIIVKHASAIVVVSKTIEHLYRAQYPHCAAKLVHIPNGFDQEQLPAAINYRNRNEARSSRRLRMIFAGKFSSIRDPEPFFRAYAGSPLLRSLCEIVLVGPIEEHITRCIDKYGLQTDIHRVGPLPYDQTLAWIGHSDIGLILGTYTKIEMTTKLYDYAAVALPILAITCKGGDVDHFVESYGGGVVLDSHGEQLAVQIISFVNDLAFYRSAARDFDVKGILRETSAELLSDLVRYVAEST